MKLTARELNFQQIFNLSNYLKNVTTGISTMEGVCQILVQTLYEVFTNEHNESDFALCRIFKSCSFDELPPDIQNHINNKEAGKSLPEHRTYLTPLGTYGEKEEWGLKANSKEHTAIPLYDSNLIKNTPMISSIFEQIGFDLLSFSNTDSSILLNQKDKDYGVFLVDSIEGSPFIPHQKDFVKPFGIQSAFGFGGVLPTSSIFVATIFSKHQIHLDTAKLFQCLAPAFKGLLVESDIRDHIFDHHLGTMGLETTPAKALEIEKEKSKALYEELKLANRNLLDLTQHQSSSKKESERINNELKREIIQRKLMEDELKIHQADLNRAQKIANFGNWVLNLENNNLVWSDEIYRIFGLKPQEFGATYDAFLASVHPDDREIVKKSMDEALFEKKPYDIEHRILRPDGTTRFVHERSDVFHDERGYPAKMVGTVVDITRYKELEKSLKESRDELEVMVGKRTEELKRVNQILHEEIHEREQIAGALRSSEKKIREIMDNVVDAIITIDDKGTITSFNPAASQIFGYSINEVVGESVNILMGEPYKSEHDQYIQNFLNTGQAKIIGIDREIIAQKKDGTLFPASLAISALVIEEKYFFTGIIRDITQQKKEEGELIQAKVIAEKANKSKSDFLSKMSHELRTPLNAILGFSQLLDLDRVTPLNNTQKSRVDLISSSGNHLLELINDVLELSTIEAGNIKLRFKLISVSKLIDETLAYIQSFAEKHQISVSGPDADLSNLFLFVDETRFKQVLVNFMTNAVKYNNKNGTVSLFTEIKGNNLRINVSDTGPGIPAERHDKVFEPFDRLYAEHSEIEGTGIGLTIAKQLTEKMNGEIGFESQVGKGSNFYVEFPLRDDETKKIDESSSIVFSEFDDASTSQSITILYIEDNQTNLTLVQQIFSQKNHIHFISATRADEGIEIAKINKPDLILMDINLPGMDGLEALKILKALEETKYIPVIALSARASQKDIDHALQAGFISYITKPINVVEFLKTTEKFIFEN